MIRDATVEDLDALVALTEQALTESPTFNEQRFNALKTRKLFESLITAPNGILLVIDREGAVVGALAGAVSAHLYVDELFAYEIGLFVQTSARGRFSAVRLIRAFEARAKALGAVEFRPGVMTAVHADRTTRLYERLGYSVTGSNLQKRF